MIKTAAIKAQMEPNLKRETLRVMRDTDAGKNLTDWESVDSYFSYIKENVKTL